MKFYVRFMALIMSFIMLTLLNGCGSKDAENKKETGKTEGKDNSVTVAAKNNLDFNGETITIIYEYQPSDQKGIDASRDRELDRIAEIEKKFNVKIEQKKGSSDYNNSIITSTLGGAPVGHIIRLNGGHNYDFIKAGVCADLTNAMKKTGIDFSGEQYFKNVADYFQLNGKNYLIPARIAQECYATSFWLFNKSVFEELNLESPYDLMKNNQWTWEKVTELAKLATKRTSDGKISRYGLGMQYAYRTLYSMIGVNGGSLGKIDKNGFPQASLNTEPVRQAMNQMYNWGSVDKVAVCNDGSLETTAIDKMFANGEIAILSGNASSINRAYNSGMTDFGVVLCPLGPNSDGYKATVNIGDGFIIPKTYEDEADKLLLLLDELYSPYEDSYETILKEDWIGRFSDKDGYNNFKKASLDSSIQVYEPFTIFNLEFKDPAFATICGNIVNGKITAGTAIDKYNDQYQALLDDNFNGYVITGLK